MERLLQWEGQNWRDVAGEISREYGVTFNEMKDMINMSPEVLQSIRENYAGLWSVMDGEFRNHLEISSNMAKRKRKYWRR